jgi:NAD(P)-dependent dehydrogenase (short-subunit alcohol dehydrogenase family)
VNQAANGGGLELVELDLASLKSARACADTLNAAGKPFDVVIANAGVMACPLGRTEDGFEMQFGTNHLGHFVLVNRIASLLNPGGRFISLSSVGHRLSDVDIEDPNFERTAYSEFVAYGRSKTANALFAVEFDRRHSPRGVRAGAVHPGAIRETQLARHLTPDVIARAVASGAGSTVSKNIPQGAATSVWAGFVTPAEDIGGKYCEDCHVAEINDDQAPFSGVRSYALDPSTAKALWIKSEEMVGERF